MMTFIMIIFITCIMLVTTITIYHVMWSSWATHWVIKLVHLSFLLSLVFNFAISLVIVYFMGEGTASGAANLLASAIFSAYVEVRKRHWHLKTPKWAGGFFGRIYGF